MLKDEPRLRGRGDHKNRFAVAYWMTLDDESRWQALAAGGAVADFDGSLLNYDDTDIEGWFALPTARE
jgi:hypothetical protein